MKKFPSWLKLWIFIFKKHNEINRINKIRHLDTEVNVNVRDKTHIHSLKCNWRCDRRNFHLLRSGVVKSWTQLSYQMELNQASRSSSVTVWSVPTERGFCSVHAVILCICVGSVFLNFRAVVCLVTSILWWTWVVDLQFVQFSCKDKNDNFYGLYISSWKLEVLLFAFFFF